MKVICIDGVKVGDRVKAGFQPFALPQDEIIEGVIYEVIDLINFFGLDAYRLVGKPFNALYTTDRFAPISDIDETEFERNYNLNPCTTS